MKRKKYIVIYPEGEREIKLFREDIASALQELTKGELLIILN